MGVTEISTILMVLGVCLDMTEKEREVTTSLMIEGFNDCATDAGTTVTGGQSIMSPWPIIGGVGITGVANGEYIMPVHAKPGDQIILTKPLASQVAVNSYQWYRNQMPQWDKIKHLTNAEELTHAYETAEESMATLNRDGASLFKKYKVAACTDVTGFGIIGHASYLAQAQRQAVDFQLHSLPLISNMLKLDKIARDFNLLNGTSAETSGGLLIVLPADQVDGYLKEFKINNPYGWHVGEVVKGNDRKNNQARIVQGCKIIEV